MIEEIRALPSELHPTLWNAEAMVSFFFLFQFWSGSELAKQFVDSLLETNPEIRLSATDALKHDWMLGERAHLNVTIKARPASEYNTMQRVRFANCINYVLYSSKN